MTDETRIPDPAQASYKRHALHYGLIGSGILIVLGLIMYLAGLSDPAKQQGLAGWLNAAFSLGVMSWALFSAMKAHRDEDLGGYMSYGRGLRVGSLTSLIMAGISLVWTLIHFTLIAPEMVEQIQEFQIAQMEAQGMSDAQIEQALAIAGWSTSPLGIAIMAAIGSFVLGFVLSLIIAGLTRNEPPETA